MKKTLALILSATFIATGFSGCAKKECIYHDYFESEIVQEATCTTTGIRKSYCSKCNHSKEVTIPIEHDFQQTSVIKEATCAVDGLGIYQCTKCGTTEERKLYEQHDYYGRTCLNCGYKKPLPELSIGMTQNQVESKWGEPLDIDKFTSDQGTSETWWYKENGNTIMISFDVDGRISYISE